MTSDPEAACISRGAMDSVIYKSVSGVRSIVSRLRDEPAARLADLANGPTQFQEYVPGKDVRVHVVGNAVLATEIRSTADDYRYASRSGAELEMEPVTLPNKLSCACRIMVHSMRLLVSGIDLRRTPEGE